MAAFILLQWYYGKSSEEKLVASELNEEIENLVLEGVNLVKEEDKQEVKKQSLLST